MVEFEVIVYRWVPAPCNKRGRHLLFRVLPQNLWVTSSLWGSAPDPGIFEAWAPVSEGQKRKAPLTVEVNGAYAFGAPSARLSLARLRPRRA